MHADLSRRTFDPADAYRAVLLQQGRVLLDADVNEQAEITEYHDEVRTADLAGRSGGPAAASSATGVAALGPFAVVGADGAVPSDAGAPAAWEELQVTPGRYYVDGVLAESPAPPPRRPDGGPGGPGWLIANQPYLATIGTGKDAVPGLPEPGRAADGDRFALYLDVWNHHVTPVEDPELLEPALGGPDTTTRLRTVWQVKAVRLPAPSSGGTPVTCSDLHAVAASLPPARKLAASLDPPGTDADPCLISSAGGYQRLENQLYRVQIHTGGAGASDPAFLWSRDNGIVMAGLTGLEVAGSVTTLTLDRLGRDEELSFTAGSVVEVTSTDLELRGEPGFLATAGVPQVVTDAGGSASALRLPVSWLAGAPSSLAALGRAPIVRRWDGGPLPLTPEKDAVDGAIALESGIRVAFSVDGETNPGDFWLIPARTVRLSYGLTQLSGTIEWPADDRGKPAEQPPAGPVHHVTPLAILRRVDGGNVAGWVVESDCRLLFPALTDLAVLDLLGGDGQTALPGDPLPEPVRVAVRAGSRPVAGAALGLDAGPGTVSGEPVTGADGTAAFTWTLAPRGPLVQTLRITRLDDHGTPVDAAVVVTGRLCVPALRLAGGDGQEAAWPGRCVPQPVLVVLDSSCGPVAGARITASASGTPSSAGLVLAAEDPGTPSPATLSGRDATATAVAVTGQNGVAAFWWQPGVDPDVTSATLDVFLAGVPVAPLRVTAQLDPAVGGLHVAGAAWGTKRPLRNDMLVSGADLVSGIGVRLNGDVATETVEGKPVARVTLELPWPLGADGASWVLPGAGVKAGAGDVIGFRDVQIAAEVAAKGREITWRLRRDLQAALTDFLTTRLWEVLKESSWGDPITGRFIIDGWAVTGADGQPMGSDFQRWFRLQQGDAPDPPADRESVTVPDVAGRTQAVATRLIEAARLTVGQVTTEPSDTVRAKLTIRTDPPAGEPVAEGSAVTLVLSAGRG